MKYLHFNQKIKAKTAIILIFAAVMVFNIGIASAQTTNFSGTWKRSIKSTAGELSINSVPPVLKIIQDDKAITIKRTLVSGRGDTTFFAETLKFDGSNSETVTPSKTKRSSSIQWNGDKKTLNQTVTSKDEQGNLIQIYKYIWSTEDDGKTLKIIADLEIKTGDHPGSYEMREMFNKN